MAVSWDRRNRPKAQAGHKIPPAQRNRVIARDKNRGCFFRFNGICVGTEGASDTLQIHHIVEYEDGGRDDDFNLTLACKPCHVHHSAIEAQKRAVKAGNDWKRKPEPHPGVLRDDEL